ncbi:MAG: Transcriptional regulator SCO1200, Xre-family with cupin domain, partial [uncultured Nocardioides sp.]
GKPSALRGARTAPRPAAAALPHPGRRLGPDRRRAEHAVAAGVRRAPAHARAADAAGARVRRHPGRAGRRPAHRRPARARHAGAAGVGDGHPADPAAGRPAGLQDGGAPRPPEHARAQHPRGLRVAVRDGGQAAPGARRPGPGARPRRGGGVRHPDPALVRLRRAARGGAAQHLRAAGGADARARL